jgi:hypothetical protein
MLLASIFKRNISFLQLFWCESGASKEGAFCFSRSFWVQYMSFQFLMPQVNGGACVDFGCTNPIDDGLF